MNITWNTAQDREVTNAIRDAIGRNVTFWLISSTTNCTQPGCDLDPVTNTSTNSFCPVCSGNYFIYTYSGEIIKAHVTWGYSEQLGWVVGGQIPEGECRVQIEYTPHNVYVADNAKWVTVDSREMQIVGGRGRRILRGVQELNRILIDLVEKEY